MTYSQFNNLILNHYLNQAQDSFCHLGVTPADFETIIPITDIQKFAELRRPWSFLFNRHADNPQYFGLLAVQCLATALMEDDDEFTSNAYQVRLMRIIGLSGQQVLQQYFREPIHSLPAQETIWEAAREYLEQRTGRRLSLPERSSFRGRFVQYPLSQALLRQQDLKPFLTLFMKHLKFGENISLSDFTARMLGHLDETELSARAAKILTDNLTRGAAWRQVFHYFVLWDGILESEKRAFNNTSLTNPRPGLVLRVREQQPEFFLYPTMGILPWPQAWDTPGFDGQHPGLRIFNAHEYYRDEFEEARLMVTGTPAWVLSDRTRWPNLYRYTKEHDIQQIGLDERFYLFYLDPKNQQASKDLRKFFASERPIRFTGGLKTGRSRVYFEGFGPYIECDQPFSVFYNDKKCAYDPSYVMAGVYSVRTANFRDAEFRIIPTASLQEIILSRSSGWRLTTMSLYPKASMEGALWHDNNKEEPLNAWLELHNGNRLARKKTYRNPLLQAIANYYEQNQ